MKKALIIFALFCLTFTVCRAQNYPNIVNYAYNGTPTNGVKIKTNMPFTSGTQMPTITITGYNYGQSDPILLTLTYYIYFNDSGTIFYSPVVSSAGAYTPRIYLANESSKVVIFIDDKGYYQRFTVTAYATGMAEQASWFQGWTIADEVITGTHTYEVAYRNRFRGQVYMPGDGLWDANGNVLIGKTNQTNTGYKLDVAGKVRADEIVVNTTGADFVFANDYKLRSLADLKAFIHNNKHLPDIPPAKAMQEEGVGVSELQTRLLQKVEELTLYILQQEERLNSQQKQIEQLKDRLEHSRKK